MLKAVIFDMDGVIIDSEPMHAKAAVLALKQYNIDITLEYAYGFIGSTAKHMCERMAEDFHLDITSEELLKANNFMLEYLLKEEGHTVLPYVIDFIRKLHDSGIKLSIASSSPAAAIEEVMESLNIKTYFNGYISGGMTDRPKPSPDIFLLAAERLGVNPSECIVVEDSYNGVTAAKAAGMTCIGFINPNSGCQDLSKADYLLEGFEDADFEFVNEVYRYSHKEPSKILTTDHFMIRELSVKDMDSLHRICQEPEINEFIDCYKEDLETEKEKLAAYIDNIYRFYGFGLWGVYFKSNGCLVGQCGVELKQLNGEEIYELSYLLDKTYQGHGYALEIVTGVIDYCFRELKLNRITAVIDKNNERSTHLAEKAGMRKSGECIRGNRCCHIYEI